MARHFLPAFLVVALVTAPAVAARRRAVVLPAPDALTITFVAAASSTLDAGTIAHDFSQRSAKGVTIVTRTFAVRVDRRDGLTSGLVTLRASIETEDPRCMLRVDGVELHIAPITVAIVPAGTATTHRIEITVPVSAEQGALLTSIRWEAATEENNR